MTSRKPDAHEQALIGQQVKIVASDFSDNVHRVGTAEWSEEDFATYVERNGLGHAGFGGRGHHWIVRTEGGTGHWGSHVVAVHTFEGCPGGPDCFTCPDGTCRLLNERKTDMPGPIVPDSVITPANVRALALSQAKQLYPEADVLDHITVADWLLNEQHPSITTVAGPTPPDTDLISEYGWSDSQSTTVRIVANGYTDDQNEIGHLRVGGGPYTYFTPEDARRVISVLQRAIASA